MSGPYYVLDLFEDVGLADCKFFSSTIFFPFGQTVLFFSNEYILPVHRNAQKVYVLSVCAKVISYTDIDSTEHKRYREFRDDDKNNHFMSRDT